MFICWKICLADIARVFEIRTTTGLGTTPLHGRAAVVSGAEGRVVVVVVVVVEVVVVVVVVVEVVVEVVVDVEDAS